MREKSISETVSDTVLSTRVKAAIYKISPEVHAMVGVNVQESEVLLTGTVPTDEMKTKVERAVWKVSGTKCVYNDIEISDKAPIVNYHKDAWITSQVKAKLLANTKIRSLNYSIKTVNNVVYIFGIARSVDELELVKNIASHVRGALRVMSYVRLKEGAN
jgi:osmotically-inducible protein OsmY